MLRLLAALPLFNVLQGVFTLSSWCVSPADTPLELPTDRLPNLGMPQETVSGGTANFDLQPQLASGETIELCMHVYV